MTVDVKVYVGVQRALALCSLCVWLMLTPIAQVVQAQDSAPRYDVFVTNGISKNKSGLFFVNVSTGLSSRSVTNGQRHSLLGGGVLFEEIGTGTIKMAYPDGRIEPYAAIVGTGSAVNWVISANGQHIAWTISQLQDKTLLSDLYVAGPDGSDKKRVLHASSTKNVDTVPLALSDDGATVFYARQSRDTQTGGYLSVSDAFRLDVASGTASQIPGTCTCSMGFSSMGRFVARLENPTDGPQTGFAVHVWDLAVKSDTRVAALSASQTQAGNVLVSSDGNLVVYTAQQASGYFIILADLTRHQQRLLIGPLKSNLWAVAFSRNNSAIMLVGADGTYKLTLKDGNLQAVSAYGYLGTISATGSATATLPAISTGTSTGTG